MVGVTRRGTVLKGRSIRKAEKQCNGRKPLRSDGPGDSMGQGTTSWQTVGDLRECWEMVWESHTAWTWETRELDRYESHWLDSQYLETAEKRQ